MFFLQRILKTAWDSRVLFFHDPQLCQRGGQSYLLLAALKSELQAIKAPGNLDKL